MLKASQILSIGFAIFCMFFGAGNVAMPMILGRNIGDQILFGILGFLLVGVIIPLLGLVSIMLCDGDYKKLLGRMGNIPGQIAAFACIMMMGPLLGTSRCIIIAHASVNLYTPAFTLFLFSLFANAIIYLLAFRQSSIIDILGKFLGPLKLFLLLAVIGAGLCSPAPFMHSNFTVWESLLQGANQGMQTGDLLGSIFFSSLIVIGIKKALGNNFNYKRLAITGIKAGSIGALCLGLVYTGFCLVSAFYGKEMALVERVNIFSTLADLVLGNIGGLFANITVAIACLTTAIALTSVFASYLSKDLLREKISYHSALIITVLATIIASNLGFNKITDYIAGPVFMLLYPPLITLSLVNIAHVLWGFKWIKEPIFLTFIINFLYQYHGYAQTIIGKMF